MITTPSPCKECEKLKNELNEKNQRLNILTKNILELKSRLFESSNLISAYIQTKEQNDNLLKENEMLRKKKEENIEKYQLEILKQKILTKSQQIQDLKLAYEQTQSLLEQYKKQCNDNSVNAKENKLKRELSEKDKYINNQNLIIERLKSEKLMIQSNINSNNNLNFETFEIEEDNKENKFKLTELLKEKEFLEDKYREYREKYYKFKYKYKEFRNNAKFFMKFYTMYNNNSSNNNIFGSNAQYIQENNTLLQKKKERTIENVKSNTQNDTKINTNRNSFDIGNGNQADIFDNRYYISDNDNVEMNNIEEEPKKIIVNEQSNTSNIEKGNFSNIEKKDEHPSAQKEKKNKEKKTKEKETLIHTSSMKTRSMEKADQMKKEKEIKEKDEKAKDDKKIKKKEKKAKEIVEVTKQEIKKQNEETPVKKKEKVTKTKKIDNKPEINKEKINEISKESAKETQSTQKNPLPHINPIKKPRASLPEDKTKILPQNLLNFFTNTNITDFTEDSISNLFLSLSTLTEKITFLLEGIASNINKLDISKVIVFIKIFIKVYSGQTPSSLKIICANFLEFINLHIKTLIQGKSKFIVKDENSYYSKDIIQTNSSSLHLISYILDILYTEANDVSEITKFIFNLISNKKVNSFLSDSHVKEIIKLVYQNYSKDKLFIHESDIQSFSSNSCLNSFYFISLYKTRIISEEIFKFIFSLYSENSNEIDSIIRAKIEEKINKIDGELLLSVEKKDKINLNSNILYLHIYQIILLTFSIRDPLWVYQNIFEKILWKEFINSKNSSAKRAYIIYYASFIFYLSIKNDHDNSPKDQIMNEFGWLYSLYNPQGEFEEKISFYDKICALSWVVDSAIITMYEKPQKNAKEVVKAMIEKYGIEVFPADFVGIIKKNKFI